MAFKEWLGASGSVTSLCLVDGSFFLEAHIQTQHTLRS